MPGAHEINQALREMRERILFALHEVYGPKFSFRDVAERTGFHPETVRRWIKLNGSPPAVFVAALCTEFGFREAFVLNGELPAFRTSPRTGPLPGKLREISDMTHQCRSLLDRLDQAEDAASQTGSPAPVAPTGPPTALAPPRRPPVGQTLSGKPRTAPDGDKSRPAQRTRLRATSLIRSGGGAPPDSREMSASSTPTPENASSR